MKVILIQNVARLGNKGDVVDVSEGYARNYLIKNNLAKEASKSAIQGNEMSKKKKAERQEEIMRKKFAFVKATSTDPLQINLRANDKGHLFEKLDKKKLVKIISEKAAADFSEKEVLLDEPIKELGRYSLAVLLSGKKLDLKIELLQS